MYIHVYIYIHVYTLCTCMTLCTYTWYMVQCTCKGTDYNIKMYAQIEHVIMHGFKDGNISRKSIYMCTERCIYMKTKQHTYAIHR